MPHWEDALKASRENKKRMDQESLDTVHYAAYGGLGLLFILLLVWLL